MQFNTKREEGFTLLEIMIVIAIIGLLVSLGIPNLIKSRSSAQIRTCIDNLRQIDGAKQQWALEHRKDSAASPLATDIQPYMGRSGSTLPSCPNDDTHTFDNSYSLNPVKMLPVCSISPTNHFLDP